MAKFTFIDLFSGIGGFHLGLVANGGKNLFFSEIDKNAIEYYCKNHNISPNKNLGDITKIKDLPKHDLLTAGVPCQSWSIAGKNLGFEDDRGQLWNDTIFLLKKTKPKAFIFENVKGLVDPRNQDAFQYILKRIKEAGYHATYHVLNSYDYGVLQNRVRVYIVGFKSAIYFDKYETPKPVAHHKKLWDIIDGVPKGKPKKHFEQRDLFGDRVPIGRTKFQKNTELNDFFLFNDIRNGHTTVHSWELEETSDREKDICYFLLKNRRKKKYGVLDGNPMSLNHFKDLDSSITIDELNSLVEKDIFKSVNYLYEIKEIENLDLTSDEEEVLKYSDSDNQINLGTLKIARELRVKRILFNKVIQGLEEKGVLQCIEKRYEFKYTKISSGIKGVNRIYLPSSDIYSTLVASDTNDFVSTVNVSGNSTDEYKEKFIKEVYEKKNYRKVTKEEACLLQGYPSNFELPESRLKWMKLIGNSVSVPVIEAIGKQIVSTGVFDE